MGSNSFYSREELESMGFKALGEDVLLSRKTNIYYPEMMSIGSHVRIDDFCIFNGIVEIGSHVHIAAFCSIVGGKAGVYLEDFTGLSVRCNVLTETDDYSGNALTNPTVPQEARNITYASVRIKKHAVLGTATTVFPGVTIGEGVSVGSMTLVNKSLEDWGIYVGIPCRRIKERSKKILELENKYFM